MCDELFAEGAIDPAAHVARLRLLCNDCAGEETGMFAAILADEIARLHLFELIDAVRGMYERDWVDLQVLGDYDSFLDFLFDYRHPSNTSYLLEDAAKEMSDWACFQPLNWRELPPVSHGKIGRNEPCPCGSGKKYKKCCLPKEEAAEVMRAQKRKREADCDLLVDEIKREAEQKSYQGTEFLLERYPPLADVPQGQLSFTDCFDPQAIEIDLPVYQALHQHSIPRFIQRDRAAEWREKIELLTLGYEKFLALCDEQGMTRAEEFDARFRVHYSCAQWLGEFLALLEQPIPAEPEAPSQLSALRDRVRGTLESLRTPVA